jgi:hypothetical protein
MALNPIGVTAAADINDARGSLCTIAPTKQKSP